jgi:hypothetical protein
VFIANVGQENGATFICPGIFIRNVFAVDISISVGVCEDERTRGGTNEAGSDMRGNEDRM